ncbi:cytochrome d ubiquinol oxidase subunit II [Halorussus halophilus]|uniref:cytochrome d ubiquinol oxidase subunit II n=1 Tax=Halorussus halophilus TaxID=2650975 RepID=UPI001300F517|nr:cytochrome d ubiquinol oxidase subunit II [Halorussus halophilus]
MIELSNFDLPTLWFAVVFAFLAVFLFLDGFDFGVGALFATRGDPEEKERLLAAIGPFWDGNEVWLVVFGGALFAAFPPVYAALFSRHYLLLFGVLGTLILRGLAPEFYEQRHDESWQRWWGRAFVVGSVGAPFLLGVFAANWLLGTAGPTLTSLVVGLAVVCMTIASGAAFLGLKLRGELREEMVAYGPKATLAFLAFAVVTLVLLASRVSYDVTSAALVALTVASGVGYVLATKQGYRYVSFVTAGGMTGSFVALVGTLMYPVVEPVRGLTVAEAAVGSPSIELLTGSAALLLPLVLTYFVVLYSAFSGPIDPEEAY